MTLNIVAVLINTISLKKGNPWCEKEEEEAPSSSSRPSASPARSFMLLLLGLPLKILQHLKAAVAKQKISDSYLGRRELMGSCLGSARRLLRPVSLKEERVPSGR